MSIRAWILFYSELEMQELCRMIKILYTVLEFPILLETLTKSLEIGSNIKLWLLKHFIPLTISDR